MRGGGGGGGGSVHFRSDTKSGGWGAVLRKVGRGVGGVQSTSGPIRNVGVGAFVLAHSKYVRYR